VCPHRPTKNNEWTFRLIWLKLNWTANEKTYMYVDLTHLRWAHNVNVESSKNEFLGSFVVRKAEVLDFKVRRQGRLALDIITIRKLFKWNATVLYLINKRRFITRFQSKAHHLDLFQSTLKVDLKLLSSVV